MLNMVHLEVYSAMSVTWTLFKFPGIWDKFNLHCILCEGGQLFKFIGKFRFLGMENLPQEFLVVNSSINSEFLEKKTREIIAGAYLVSLSEIVNDVQQIGAGALLVVSNYILSVNWGNDPIYLFNSHSKSENDKLSSSGTAVLLKYDRLCSMESYGRLVCYITFLLTLYLQVQFLRIYCTANVENAIKYELKNKQLKARHEKDLLTKKIS